MYIISNFIIYKGSDCMNNEKIINKIHELMNYKEELYYKELKMLKGNEYEF